jgi:hypothetical protein
MARTTYCRVGGSDDVEAESAIVVFIQRLYDYNYCHVNRIWFYFGIVGSAGGATEDGSAIVSAP